MAFLNLSDDMSSSSSNSDIIPLTSRALHKFYEPLVLFEALNIAAKDRASTTASTEAIGANNLEKLYYTFVYKLAHVCDSVKGNNGGSVTAVMILRSSSGGVHYHFASNSRTPEQLEETSDYIDRLLRQVRENPKRLLNQGPVLDVVLQSVLVFNRPRIIIYLKGLQSQARDCLHNCSNLDLDERTIAERCISDILETANSEALLTGTKSEFITGCEILLDQLNSITQSQAGIVIQARALQGRMPGHKSQECWSEFQHTISRIQAYPQSVQYLRKAQKQWPDLFKNYDILAIPSSSPIPRPCRNKSQTANGIVGRMARKQDEIETFRSFVSTLQSFDLDDRIQHQWRNEHFRPIVHAEIILLNWLENNGGISPDSFFNWWMYIGSSKPTCRLCHYYFEAHRSGVKHRPSHGNLYISWRFPDIFVSQGAHAQQARQVIMDRMLVKIRKDTFQLVMQKVPPSFKEHDSNTFSAVTTLRNSYMIDVRSSTDVDDLTSLLNEASLVEV